MSCQDKFPDEWPVVGDKICLMWCYNTPIHLVGTISTLEEHIGCGKE